MIILKAEKLSKTYTIGDREIPILENIFLEVDAGEFLVVTGVSGSGKTTLLSLLSGLDYPTSGRVRIEGTDITRLSEDDLAPYRNVTMGFVFQSFHLVPSLNARENIMFPAELNRDAGAAEKADRLMTRVGLDGRRFHFPHQLSGGEKQRVALCRALINNPRIVFADEPTGNLDSENSAAILELMMALRKEYGATLIMVTHSTEIAEKADRIVTLRDGRIVGDGPNDA